MAVGQATKEDLRLLEQRIIAKIEEAGHKIEANAAKIEGNIAKIEENGRKIEANATKIEENGHRIEENGQRLDRLTREVVEIRERLAHTLTREEFKGYFDEIIRGQDAIMKIVVRLDQERTATDARLDRVEADVEKNKRDIKAIKAKLAMP